MIMDQGNDMGSPTAEIVTPAPEQAVMAVRDLMSAANTIFQLAAQKSTARSVILEANDIELTYVQLGRMLSAIRKGQNRAA